MKLYKKIAHMNLKRGSIDLDNLLHCAYALTLNDIHEVYRFIKIEHNVAMATDARIASFSLLYHDYEDGYYVVYKKSRTSLVMYRIDMRHAVERYGWRFPDIYSIIPQEKRTKIIEYEPTSMSVLAKLNKALPQNSGLSHVLLNKIIFSGKIYLPEEDMQPLFFVDTYGTKYSIIMPIRLSTLD